jgi:hypothetical protein
MPSHRLNASLERTERKKSREGNRLDTARYVLKNGSSDGDFPLGAHLHAKEGVLAYRLRMGATTRTMKGIWGS